MKPLFWIILTFLFFACSPPKNNLHQSVVDLDSLTKERNIQPDAERTPAKESVEPQPPSNDSEEESPAPSSLNNTEPDPPSSSGIPSPPSTITLIAQTLPVSEPHAGSPGGVIADTLRIFQCDKIDANSQERFSLHVINYRIHTLGVHPLCEVMQVADVKKILAYAKYQREFCDTYTSKFIKEMEQYQCTQIINLVPSGESKENPA